jgi:general secretion pathway protein A
MYEEYYGFVQSPFSLTPDPRFLYRSESHDIALQQVWQAIRRKEGFIVLTGDIGTGKTTLCRTILEQFDPTTFTALVLNPFLSVEELLRDVLLSFGVVSRDTLRSGRLATASKHELIRTLHDFLLSLVPIHASAVLIIDEAQHLSPEVLEEIRILSNLETNEQKLLQILLVGQLNLLDVLHNARLRQLDQRISIRCLLKPLNREEVEAYITHRLWVARGSAAVSFSSAAIDVVHAVSGGVPRIINLLCDRALMIGSEAQTEKITDAFINDAAERLGLTVPAPSPRAVLRGAGRRKSRLIAAVLLAAGAVGAAAWFLVSNPLDSFDGVSPPAVPPVRMESLGVRSVPAPAPDDDLRQWRAPSLEEGYFAVLVGTYATPRDLAAAEQVLKARKVPYYAVDLWYDDGIRRRLMAGRYVTREEAERVRADLATSFATASVATAVSERYWRP